MPPAVYTSVTLTSVEVEFSLLATESNVPPSVTMSASWIKVHPDAMVGFAGLYSASTAIANMETSFSVGVADNVRE